MKKVHSDPEHVTQICDHPDCFDQGEHRAPKSREQLDEYYYFCLEHAREYNEAWDFFADYTAVEIYDQYRRDAGWDRPTWHMVATPQFMEDKLRQFAQKYFQQFSSQEQAQKQAYEQQQKTQADSSISQDVKDACAVLGVQPDDDFDDIKVAFRIKAKEHHPDRHLDDQAKDNATEEFKAIVYAYHVLKAQYN